MVVKSFLKCLPEEFDYQPNSAQDQGKHLDDSALVLPFGGAPSSFKGPFLVIFVTSSRERKSYTQDEVLRSDFVPGDQLYSLLIFNIHLNNVNKS